VPIKIEEWSLLALTRFVLALIVVFAHVEHMNLAPLGWLSWIPTMGAFEAVLGFLVISGYSIGSSYRQQPQGFLKRRAWRIYPVYIGAILLSCLVLRPALDLKFGVTVFENLFFLNQFATDTSLVGPAWSLALEFWLYCLTPWLWRANTEHLRIAIFASFAAYCCYELARSAFQLPYYAGTAFGINLPLLSCAWLAGLLIAREPALARRTLRDCGVVFYAHISFAFAIQAIHRWKHAELGALWSDDLMVFLSRASTLACVLQLFKWIVEGQTGTTRSSTMRLLGDVSYPLYLVHGSILIFVAGLGMRIALVQVAAALIVSLLFYLFIDYYSRTRERRSREPQGAVAGAGSRVSV